MNNYFQQQQPRFSAFPPVVKNLLIANILAFIATYVLQSQGYDLVEHFGLHYFESPTFKIYQLVTCMFLHGGFMHIA
ncbi:MAG TPA: rhomboid family intramembrane serine protease, partial [Bacteroidia bacterium]|nr:rhomboid family intramembrane serine protease [Bacteroidia bacterium]